MLVISVGTDKLVDQSQSNDTVSVIVYAIICGNAALQGAVTAYTSIPTLLFLLFGVGMMLLGTYGALICCVLSVILFYAVDPVSLPAIEGFSGWNFFTLAFLLLWPKSDILVKGAYDAYL